MSKSIIDSSILIDCLRGYRNAVSFLASQSDRQPPATHVIVAAELLAGARNQREQDLIESFLAAFTLLLPDSSDALAALELYKTYRLSHGVDWPDCQIAATALRLGLDVHTRNIKHFSAFPSLNAISSY